MFLNDAKIRAAKPRVKRYALKDGDGLFLEIPPEGKKRWRFRYAFQGKDNELSLGLYPDVPLRGCKHASGVWIKGARDIRDEYRQLLAAGIDPSAQRKAVKAPTLVTHPFQSIAEEWHEKNKGVWSEGYAKDILRRLEVNIFPVLGNVDVGEITPPMLCEALNAIDSRGVTETAHRVQALCRNIFDYAIQTGRCTTNPAANMKGVLRPVVEKHLAALTDPKAVAGLLRSLDSYMGGVIVSNALRLAPLVFVRPGELRTAEWAEMDLDKALWEIPASKMKMREPHIVPLSSQSLAILRAVEPFTRSSRYVFPSPRKFDRPMSNNAILAALRTLGYGRDQMTGHGFRAMARTILDEVLEFPVEYIEQQLAHRVLDPLGNAYNRTKHLSQRQAMMQKWADYLDKLKSGRP